MKVKEQIKTDYGERMYVRMTTAEINIYVKRVKYREKIEQNQQFCCLRRLIQYYCCERCEYTYKEPHNMSCTKLRTWLK